MESRLVLNSTTVTREIEIGGGVTNKDERDALSFAEKLAQRVPHDTGFLPPGVMCIRGAGDHEQIVLQFDPAVNYVNWGTYEGDAKAKVYLLAQPYRIIVCDTLEGNLLGCRMFYSPERITDPDQPLYHQNVPNINCKGYRGNGVGWVCLYHRDQWADLSIAQKVARITERCSGAETYNDANMSSTDGARFYQAAGKAAHVWDPNTWEKKSKTEGFEWTRDKDLWIPILVKDIDTQDKHYPNGIPLTLGMAMVGNAAAYYGDTYQPKLINAIAKGSETVAKDIFQKIWTAAYVQAAAAGTKPVAKVKPTKIIKVGAGATPAAPQVQMAAAAVALPPQPVKMYTCSWCQSKHPEVPTPTLGYGHICETCLTTKFFMCKGCSTSLPTEFQLKPGYCKKHFCVNCGEQTSDFISNGCKKCLEWTTCQKCDKEIAGNNMHKFSDKHGTDFIMCSWDMEATRVCNECGWSRDLDDCYTIDGKSICFLCAAECNHCGAAVIADDDWFGACKDCQAAFATLS